MMSHFLDRGIVLQLTKLLAAIPVLVLEGPRASGKTAIGEMLLRDGIMATHVDLSDPTVLAAAAASPTSFVDALQTPAFVDEAQLLPEIALAIKRRVDRDRKRGAFVLTGSSRLGRTQLGGSDPLAGRALRLRLWPMTQGELQGQPINLVATIASAEPFGVALPKAQVSRADLLSRIRRGGLPSMAGIAGAIEPLVRAQLAQEYVEGVLYHEIGSRHDRAEMMRLLRYVVASTARIANVSSMANDLGTSRTTINERLSSLESSFLVHKLAGHRSSEHRTLTAHPKLHAVDSGLAAWALRLDDNPPAAVFGAMVETFVVNELLAQSSWSYATQEVRHWRDTARKLEVDAVLLNADGSLIAVEIKAGTDVRPDDLKGLSAFLADTPEARRGIVFYTGALVLQLAEKIWAVPISALWTGVSRVKPRR